MAHKHGWSGWMPNEATGNYWRICKIGRCSLVQVGAILPVGPPRRTIMTEQQRRKARKN